MRAALTGCQAETEKGRNQETEEERNQESWTAKETNKRENPHPDEKRQSEREVSR